MWVREQAVETTASAEDVWALWADVVGWPRWNADIEQIELDGPFAVGGTIVMTPAGDDPVELRIAEAVEPTVFVDEADFAGPAGDTIGPQIGPQISSDFPQVLAALVALAEQRGNA